MRIPTHVVVDVEDGWTWARDQLGHPFTEETATIWAVKLNAERKPEHRTFVVCTVTPVESPEYLAALARTARISDHIAMIEDMEAQDMRGD